MSLSLDKGQGDPQLLLEHKVVQASDYEGCMLVYDVTFADTMRGLEATCELWRQTPSHPALCVLASRVDCDKADWEVSPEEGKALSRQLGAPFLQVSARTDTGLEEEVITSVVHGILRQRAMLKVPKGVAEASSEGKHRIVFQKLKRFFHV